MEKEQEELRGAAKRGALRTPFAKTNAELEELLRYEEERKRGLQITVKIEDENRITGSGRVLRNVWWRLSRAGADAVYIGGAYVWGEGVCRQSDGG